MKGGAEIEKGIITDGGILRTIKVYTLDTSTAEVYTIEWTAVLKDRTTSVLKTINKSFNINIVNCDIQQFSSFP